MGAKASTEFGQIHVKIDKPSYFQGEYVYGSVYLNLVKDFPGNELFIKLKGKEEARWSEGSGNSTRHYHGKKIIISHQFTLHKFAESHIPAGQYSFPFSVFLPATLPASFYNSDIFAMVSYKIKGEINITDKNYKHFRSSKELIIKQSKNEDFAPICKQMQVDVDICCCFKQGFTDIETKVNKTFFFEGEMAEIQCIVNNSQCDLPLYSVEMQLIRRLSLKSKGEHQYANDKIFYTKIHRLNLPTRSVSPGKTVFQMKIISEDKEELPSSSQGEVVKNNYFIAICPIYESFLCNCLIKKCETPFLLYDSKSKDSQLTEPQAPENWSPQMMPVHNFDWKTAQMYKGKNAEGYDYPSLDVQNQMLQQNVPFQPNYNNHFDFILYKNKQIDNSSIAMNFNSMMNYYNNEMFNDDTQALKQPLYGEKYDDYGFHKDLNKI